jgi:hypothetical protein
MRLIEHKQPQPTLLNQKLFSHYPKFFFIFFFSKKNLLNFPLINKVITNTGRKRKKVNNNFSPCPAGLLNGKKNPMVAKRGTSKAIIKHCKLYIKTYNYNHFLHVQHAPLPL